MIVMVFRVAASLLLGCSEWSTERCYVVTKVFYSISYPPCPYDFLVSQNCLGPYSTVSV